jgi:hypothetical protein
MKSDGKWLFAAGCVTGKPEVLYKGMSSEKHFSLSRKPEVFSRHPARTTFFLFFL